MPPVPFHPAAVHGPLGLAPVVLLACVAVGISLWRGGTSRAWWGPAALQGLVVLGVLAARKTGEDEEHGLKGVSEALHAAIEAHEAAADVYSVLAVVTAVLLVGAAAARNRAASGGLGALGALGAVACLVAGIRTGHLGGEIVFVHDVASARQVEAAP